MRLNQRIHAWLLTAFLLSFFGTRAQAQSPTITSISPTSGPVGSTVIVSGTNFGSAQGSSTVLLGETNATALTWSSTSITVLVPTGGSSGEFTVTVGGQNATSPSFTVTTVPSGWSDTDIGTVGQTGSSSYANGVFTVKGAGGGIVNTADGMHFVYQPISTSGSIVARVVSLSGGASSEQAGVLIRQTLNAGSIAAGTLFSSSKVYLDYRSSTGGSDQASYQYSASLPYWIEVIWSGGTFTTYMSSDGVNWFQTGSETLSMGSSAYIGLGVSSYSTSELATATFDNVSISSSATPAPVITAVSATSGSVGSPVTITGNNFGSSQGNSLVTVSEVPTVVNSWSNTSISITIPSGATSGPLVVSVAPSMNDSNDVVFTVTSQPLPNAWLDQDVGQVGTAGSSSFANGEFTVVGAGGGMYSYADGMHFVYQPLSGNGSIVARVVSLQGTTNAEAGVMIRETLTPGSTMADPYIESGYSYFGYRTTTGGGAEASQENAATLPYWLQVVRNGSSFSEYISRDGVNWAQIGTTETITMATNVYIGLVVSSRSTTTLATATFDNVSINSSAAPAPTITGISATTASIGSQVQINGTSFGAAQGNSTLLLNDSPVTINSWSDTTITLTIPSAATSGPLAVLVAPSMNATNPVNFVVTSQPLPSGWLDQDIGSQIQVGGSATYSNGVFTVKGAGAQIGGSADGTHLVYQQLSGNGSIIARVVSIQGTSGAQAGVMIRETLNSGATMAVTMSWASDLYFVYRSTTGGNSATNTSQGQSVPYWIQITRSGNTFTSYISPDGFYWIPFGTTETIDMAETVYIGLMACSGNTTNLATITFDNVSVNSATTPAPAITSESSSTGTVGTQLWLYGYNFGAVQGNSQVTLNAVPVTVNSWSDTAISITIPSGATSGLMVVSVAPSMNDSNPVPFTVTSNPLPVTTLDEDVGQTGVAGSSGYSNGVYTVTGAGGGILGTADAMHFVYMPLSGNGSIVARIASLQGTSGAQAGVMIRETLNPGATMAYTEYRAGYVYFGYRSTTGGSYAFSQTTSESLPYWVEIVRNGNSFSSYMSLDGVNWVQIGSTETIDMATDVYIGLAVSSDSTTTSATATFDNVSFNSTSAPPPAITSVSATTGSVGAQVAINGTGFGATQGNSQVLLNDLAATINSWSATAISITVPTGATSGPLVVAVAPTMNSSNPVTFTITSQPLPAGWLDQDIGQVGYAGSATYSSGVFTVKGAGYENSSSPEGLHYVYTPLSGNGTIIARVTALSGTASPMAGVMIRETVNSGDMMAYTYYTTNKYSYFMCRETTGGSNSYSDQSAGSLPYWEEVVRNGSTLSGYESPDGVNWTQVWTNQTIDLATNVYVGLAVADDATTGLATATFDNVSFNPGASGPSPVISSLSPSAAPIGTWVVFSGENFEPTPGTSTVTFGGVPATINSLSNWSGTSFQVQVPSGLTAGTNSAVVTVGGQASNSEPFAVLPTVTSLSPASGVAGSSVTITGATFGASQGGSTVSFNGVVASSVTSWSNTQIVATVPSGATTGPVTISVNSASNNPTAIYDVINPTISSISPANGPITGTVTISGSGFGPTEGEGEVYFNGTTATASAWTDTAITAVVPYGATSGPVTVASSGLTSNGMQFNVEGTLAVTSISPTAGPIGSSVNIIGTGFGTSQGTNSVALNELALTVSSWSDTEITVTIPSGAATGAFALIVDGLTVSSPTFTINSTLEVTDSLGNQSSYTSVMYGGEWYIGQSDGSGCSTCDIRGTISSTFDNRGNVLTKTDELGHVTTYTYNSNDDVLTVVQPAVSAGTPTWTYTYNSFGEVLTATDPLGHVTTNTYDAHGNLLSVATPAPSGNAGASVTQFTYNSFGELTQIQDPLNRITTIAYNSVGLIASITDPQGNTTSYGYDARGNRNSVTDAMNHQTTFAYDSGNRLTGITYPDNSTAGFTYDYRGRRITATDQNGKTTQYAYDAADRLTSVTDPASHVTQYTYDTEDNLLNITDANNNTTTFSYDAYGRVYETNFPSSHSESYQYDADNNLTSKTDRNGNTIQYIYDALNRMTQKTYPDSTSVEYTYDLVGKILQVNDPTGTYGFAYDNMGRLIGTTTQYSFLSGTNFTNSHSYDADSNRIGYTAPDGSTNAYTYDMLNRLTNLANSWAGSFGFSYDSLSRRTQMTRPNGISTTYSYDSLSRLLSVVHQLSGSTIDGAVYTLDAAGNRTAKVNDLSGGTTTNYGYDAIYELLSATQGANTTESYTYDPVGNRLTSLTAASYSYNVSNEMTSNSNASYTYDYNGNTTSKTASGNTTNYSWDFENRLTQVTLPNSGGTVSFRYDPFGRRIYKQSPTAASIFVYDGANLSQVVSSTGSLVARYAQTTNVDEPLAMQRGGTTYYFEADGLGSITSLSNSAGALANTYTYDSFGNVTNSTGSVTNLTEYTGREFDSETGLYYYRARYFDPISGRFMGEDPLEFGGDSPNFYVYSLNNPVANIDPSGLLSVCCRQVKSTLYVLCHCFLVLSDNKTTLGAYKFGGRLIPLPNLPDDNPIPASSRCQLVPFGCKSDQNILHVFNEISQTMPSKGWRYGIDGTSNTIPGEVLRQAGFSNFNFPLCAVGSGWSLPPLAPQKTNK